ncbi:hypothetical protein K439DRAFT_1523609 [Ramaria rubella]|nr:hypothetical protein K439DRAFT_1523609 [Ramaria rubella]
MSAQEDLASIIQELSDQLLPQALKMLPPLGHHSSLKSLILHPLPKAICPLNLISKFVLIQKECLDLKSTVYSVESPTPAYFQMTAPAMNMGGNLSRLVSGGSPAVDTPTLPEIQDQVQQFAHQFLLQLLQLLNGVMRDTSVAVQWPRRETRNEPTREGYLAMRNEPTRDGYVADEDEVDSDL